MSWNRLTIMLLAALLGQASGAVVSAPDLSLSITVTINPTSLPATITAAVTGDSNGDGFLDRLTLSFSRPVDIVDGGGVGDGFDAIVLSGGRLIAAQDYAATNVTSLVLQLVPESSYDSDDLISATYHAGFSSSIRNTGFGQAMADTTSAAGSDGASPVFLGLLPGAGATITDTALSYTLSETLTVGTATWTWVGGTADTALHNQALTGTELAQGAHTAIVLANPPTLVSGAIYDLSLSGQDAAGNAAIVATSAGLTFNPSTRPRIISDAPLWVVGGQPWTYDVRVDTRALHPSHVLNPPDTLTFALIGPPPGLIITKTGRTTARVFWPVADESGPHQRIVISVTDSVTTTDDRQEVLLYVVPVPGGGG